MTRIVVFAFAALVLAALLYLGVGIEDLKQTVRSQSELPAEGQTQSLELGNVVEDGKVVCGTDALKTDCTDADRERTANEE
jgi:hypothetical protein